MATIRVNVLARELGVSVDELLKQLGELGIPAKTSGYPLQEDQVAKVRKDRKEQHV